MTANRGQAVAVGSAPLSLAALTLCVATQPLLARSSWFPDLLSRLAPDALGLAALLPFASSVVLTLVFAYATRHRATGGWLFVYYATFYNCAVNGILNVVRSADAILRDFNPAHWNGFGEYSLFLLGTVAPDLLLWTNVIVSSMLLATRSESGVRRVRRVLVAGALAQAVALAIDIVHPGHSNAAANSAIDAIDASNLVSLVVWGFYFHRSRRVRCVFIEKSWVPMARAAAP